jgi:hypothetical protein
VLVFGGCDQEGREMPIADGTIEWLRRSQLTTFVETDHDG